MTDLVAIGCAVVDVVARVTTDFLRSHGLRKGTMVAFGRDEVEKLSKELSRPQFTPGGSAANSAAVLADLGGRARFVGRVAPDELGALFRAGLNAYGVAYDCPPTDGGSGPTGRVIVLVTPDGDRTMCGFLGASCALAPTDIESAEIAQSSLVLIEGYMLGAGALPAFERLIDLTSQSGARLALAVGDEFCISTYRREFDRVLAHCDIVFANTREACTLARAENVDGAIEWLAARCETVVVTHGSGGSTVIHEGERLRTSAMKVIDVTDATGAGDAFAGGFLYGLARSLSISESVQLANERAVATINQLGARPQPL